MTRSLRALVIAGTALVLATGLSYLLRETLRGPARTADAPGGDVLRPVAVDPTAAAAAAHPAPTDLDELAGAELQWVVRNNEAGALLEAGELEAAVAIFEECHAALPDRKVFRRNLAEALVRLARREHDEDRKFIAALEHLGRAIELAPGREDLETLRGILERWRAEWELARFHTSELSVFFEISYDASREDILLHSQEAIRFLDTAYADLAEWFLVDPVLAEGKPRFHVVLYNREEFDRLTGLGDWAGGVFDGTIRVSVEHLQSEAERWGRTLRHELTHAFVGEVGGPEVSGWLNEGLAQYFDTSIHASAQRSRLVAEARSRLRGRDLFPLAALEGSLATWSDKYEISIAYAQSLALVDFIARQYGTEALRAMLDGTRLGTGAPEAFRTYTGGVSLEEALDFLRSDLAR